MNQADKLWGYHSEFAHNVYTMNPHGFARALAEHKELVIAEYQAEERKRLLAERDMLLKNYKYISKMKLGEVMNAKEQYDESAKRLWRQYKQETIFGTLYINEEDFFQALDEYENITIKMLQDKITKLEGNQFEYAMDLKKE